MQERCLEQKRESHRKVDDTNTTTNSRMERKETTKEYIHWQGEEK